MQAHLQSYSISRCVISIAFLSISFTNTLNKWQTCDIHRGSLNGFNSSDPTDLYKNQLDQWGITAQWSSVVWSSFTWLTTWVILTPNTLKSSRAEVHHNRQHTCNIVVAIILAVRENLNYQIPTINMFAIQLTAMWHWTELTTMSFSKFYLIKLCTGMAGGPGMSLHRSTSTPGQTKCSRWIS